MNNKVLFISLFFIYIASYSQSNNISVERIYKELNDTSLHYIKFSDTINLIQGDQINKKKKLDFLLLDISIPHNLKNLLIIIQIHHFILETVYFYLIKNSV